MSSKHWGPITREKSERDTKVEKVWEILDLGYFLVLIL